MDVGSERGPLALLLCKKEGGRLECCLNCQETDRKVGAVVRGGSTVVG